MADYFVFNRAIYIELTLFKSPFNKKINDQASVLRARVETAMVAAQQIMVQQKKRV